MSEPAFGGAVVDVPAGGPNHAIAVLRGPGGSVAVLRVTDAVLANAHAQASAAATQAAAAMNAGRHAGEWDAVIRAKDEVEIASANAQNTDDFIRYLQALAGIPAPGPMGDYLQARAALRVALGFPA